MGNIHGKGTKSKTEKARRAEDEHSEDTHPRVGKRRDEEGEKNSIPNKKKELEGKLNKEDSEPRRAEGPFPEGKRRDEEGEKNSIPNKKKELEGKLNKEDSEPRRA